MIANEILGYYPTGEPIYPTEPGMIYTQAFINCHVCGRAIRNMGGPAFESICVECYEAEQKTQNESA